MRGRDIRGLALWSPRALPLALAALGTLVALVPPCAADRGPELERYVDLVERYASGERKGAVTALGAWRDADIETATDLLVAWSRGEASGPSGVGTGAFEAFPIRCAALLHAERAQGETARARVVFHVTLGRRLVHLRAADPQLRDFARRLYIAMTLWAYGQSRWDLALDLATKGLELFPGEPELLLAAGSIEETAGFLGLFGSLEPPSQFALGSLTARDLWERTERRRHLDQAEKAFVGAITADPSFLEARLRLGRVLWRRGEADQARPHLEAVVAGSKDADLSYLAHLFLGRIHEDGGRPAEAAREFEAARDTLPRAQTPHLALAHLKHAGGDVGGSREAILRALEPLASEADFDPFWEYGWGKSGEAEACFEALVAEATK